MRHKMKNIILFLFLITFLGIVVGANIYLSRRFAWYFSISNIKSVYIIFAFLTVFMFGGIIAFTNSASISGNIFYLIAATLMGILLYLIISALFVDLLHFIIKVKPVFYGIAAISLTLIISAYGIWNSYNLKTTQITIPLKGITRQVRAMHVSDVHLGHFRGKTFMQKIVDATKKQDVDLVFITGDLFDGKYNLNMDVLSPLKELVIPIYFVEGNHDGYSGLKSIKTNLRQTGVHVLENEVSPWGELQIIGLNHMPAGSDAVDMHSNNQGVTIKNVLSSLKIDTDIPSILLHHSPNGVKFANEAGVDLFLAGHTHAGQLFPIDYISRLMFQYYRGAYDYNGTRIFVSEGAGTVGPPMRVGTKSEIAVITLKPE
jgi:predicted MPP superfamily phosphohydrolase